MKLPCEIVQDLLPLYEENLCSPASQAAVEEHLKECTACRVSVENMKNLSEPEPAIEISAEDGAVAKSFRKVRRRWKGSLAAMLLLVPVLMLMLNQIMGRGICFTNVDDILAVRRFVCALEQKDFEKAAQYTEFETMYEEIQNLKVSWPDVNGSGYRTVVMSDRSWIVTDSFFEEYLRWDDDEVNFWENIIFNHVQQVMIPEDVWNEITSKESDIVQTTEEGEMIFDSTVYVCLDTQCGRYIVEKDSPLADCTSAEDFYSVLEFIPMDIFKEAKPELEKQAWEQYYYLKDTYDEAKQMTLGEFTSYMQEKYAAELKACAEQGFTFESTGFEGAYYNDEWKVTYGMQVTYNGSDFRTSITCAVRDGKIDIFAIGASQETTEQNIVSEALFAHYAD